VDFGEVVCGKCRHCQGTSSVEILGHRYRPQRKHTVTLLNNGISGLMDFLG